MTHTKILAAISALLIMVSCADTDQYIYNADADTSTSILTYNDALERWEAILSSESFVDATDVIPTSETDDEYDDYLENQESTRRVDIVFDADTAYVTTTQSDEQVHADISGAHVTLRLDRKKLIITLSGSTTDGSLKIYSENKFQLHLNGLAIANPRGAAINIQSKKRAFLTIAAGTQNTLADAQQYTDTIAGEDQKGCLFSEGQVIISPADANGTPLTTSTNAAMLSTADNAAVLTVTGNARHAIATDEYLFIHPGIQLSVSNAQKDGIHTNDGLRMTGGLLRIYAQKDAVQADTLGIRMTGGRLYTCAKRPYNADPLVVTSPAVFIGISSADAYAASSAASSSTSAATVIYGAATSN